MSHLIGVMLTGLVLSYLGSIPPGTLNLSVIQMGIKGQPKAALFFALASAIVEFVYAGLAVKAQQFFMANAGLADFFGWITTGMLLVMGLVNLLSRPGIKAEDRAQLSARGGFWQGFLLSCLNPMAIPYWIAVTAALHAPGWLLITTDNLLFYLFGISAGTFLLLLQASRLGAKLKDLQQNHFLMYRLPGFILISLSIYTFCTWAL